MEKLISFIGIFVMIFIAYLMSEDKKNINWRLVGTGVGIQIVFGLLFLKWEPGQKGFEFLSQGVTKLLNFTTEGTSFLFGGMVNNESLGFVFALNVLPTIIFFSALMAVLYYIGIMDYIIKGLALVMTKLLGTSGAESLSAAANIFVGQTEAPLVIKPFLPKMTRSELLTVMTGGMATVSGGVMAGYVLMGADAAHLIAASIMSAPASLIIAKIMLPEREEPVTKGKVEMDIENIDANIIDAASRGAGEGLAMAMNVGAMLIAFIALIALVNALFGFAGSFFGHPEFSLNTILSFVFMPLSYIMGVPSADLSIAADILGQKVVINEFIAYSSLGEVIKSGAISERTIVILTYALCGFANFSSIGIQVGGIGTLAPGKRHEIAKLGMRSMIGGCLAAFMTATIAGILI